MSSEDVKNNKVIEAEDLHKSYGSVKAVDGVSFWVEAGEVFGILGPNGAGKTTTTEMLEGMLSPDSGIARINGIDVQRNNREIKRVIGIQLQTSSFFDKLSLAEILELFGSLFNRRVDAQSLLAQVEMEDKAGSLSKHLSGGQQQRF